MVRRTSLLAAAVLTALALVAPATAAGAAVNPPAGLWASDYPAPTTIDDNGTVELGVKFITSAPLVVEGVRIYRVDAGDVTGTLWTASGTQLATGQFSPFAGPGWQDLIFAQPVQITPGTVYIASYRAPNADYAYQHYFFTNGSFTEGPITAKQSIVGDLNGVFSYNFPFPTDSYRDSNYWVTPLWPSYSYTGFFQPVDNDALNKAKAGSAIPVKFSLGGDEGLGILNAGYPKVTPIACDASEEVDAIEETVPASVSGLTYDPYTDQYVYVWKTNKAWGGKCYRFDLGLNDGSSHTFDVQFVK
jgi:Domain of unknown function (DUF4082)